MADEILTEELEVLESIYPEELNKVSDRELSIIVEPEEPLSGLADFKLVLHVVYPPEYPDVYPNVSLDELEGEDREGMNLTTEEKTQLLQSLEEVGKENLSTAMTFTLVSHLREQLFTILKERAERVKREEMEKERRAIEEEEARTRGTAVTRESFLAWRNKFMAEMKEKKRKEEEERMKGLTTKERDALKTQRTRLTGRELFERGGPQALTLEDANLVEEGTESVDVGLFERENRGRDEREEQAGMHFSDSD